MRGFHSTTPSCWRNPRIFLHPNYANIPSHIFCIRPFDNSVHSDLLDGLKFAVKQALGHQSCSEARTIEIEPVLACHLQP